MQSYSNLQVKILVFLLFTFLIGLGVKYWRAKQPLPEVDPELEKRFVAIADSLNAIELLENKGETPEHSENKSEQNIQININEADISELQALPGIGPVLAKRILAYRMENGRYRNMEELLKVKGIGKKKLENFSDLIVLE